MAVTETPTARPLTVFSVNPLSLNVLGGVEGYTGSAARALDLGATFGVTAAWTGLEGFLGVEVGYSGAAIDLATSPPVSAAGPNIYRNGAYLDVLPALPIPLDRVGTLGLRPYLLGGIGVDAYRAQGNFVSALGYQTTSVGSMPFGLGVQLKAGHLVADARFNGVWEMSQWAPQSSSNIRYQAQLGLGAAF
jgi:hypothetical protein